MLNAFSWRFALNSREFQLAFSAERIERELTESLQHHNQCLTQTVEDKTRKLRTTIDRLDVLTKTDTLTNLANRTGSPITSTARYGIGNSCPAMWA